MVQLSFELPEIAVPGPSIHWHLHTKRPVVVVQELDLVNLPPFGSVCCHPPLTYCQHNVRMPVFQAWVVDVSPPLVVLHLGNHTEGVLATRQTPPLVLLQLVDYVFACTRENGDDACVGEVVLKNLDSA